MFEETRRVYALKEIGLISGKEAHRAIERILRKKEGSIQVLRKEAEDDYAKVREHLKKLEEV